MFKPFPKAEPDPESIDSIVVAFQKNVGALRQSGHNIIFATIALHAIYDHEDYATPPIVTGIGKLIQGFDRAPPGRGYYAKDDGWLTGHHQHIRLWRSLPNVESELGAVVKSARDPRDSAYWEGMLKRDEARLTHRIKTLYGFYTLRRFIEDEAMGKKADDAFLYLMA